MTHTDAREGSPVNDDLRPRVQMPRGGPSFIAFAGAAAIAAVGLFATLEARRNASAPHLAAPAEGGGTPTAAAVPDLEVPPPPPVDAVAVGPVAPPPPISPRQFTPAPPAPFVPPPSVSQPPPPPFVSQPRFSQPPAFTAASGLSGIPFGAGGTGDTAILYDQGASVGAPPVQQSAQGDDAPIRAGVLKHASVLIPQGTVIPAVLETPIDTAHAGPLRALTTRDTRGFDGSRILVPKGSRLVGELGGETRSGQSRVLVTWTRLIRPDGVTIRIGSPASDTLGGIGIAGNVNNHVFARLSNAVLQTALAAGAQYAARPSDGGVSVNVPIQNLSSQAVSNVGQVLIPNADLTRPTIKVKSGAAITVFVAHDLDFAGTPAWP